VLARGGKGATRREATGSGKVGEDEGEALRRASLPKKKKKRSSLEQTRYETHVETAAEENDDDQMRRWIGKVEMVTGLLMGSEERRPKRE
jgi:hypothetical protein